MMTAPLAVAVSATPSPQAPDAWFVARLFAVDPAWVGGIVVRAAAGPVRERWLADLRACLPLGDPCRVLPIHVDAGRLLGGIDLGATLQRGRPVAQRGVLAEGDGVVVVVRFKNPRGTDFSYLLAMIDQSYMSRANTIVVPGARMDLAMQLILTPLILRLMDIRRAQHQ